MLETKFMAFVLFFNVCTNKRNLGCGFVVFGVNLSVYELLWFGFEFIVDKGEISLLCFVKLSSGFEKLFYILAWMNA